MFKEEPLLNPPPHDAALWRYMDFTQFASLLERRSLFFARADKLGDPFEGYLPRRSLESLKCAYSDNADPKKNIFWNITQVLRTVVAFTLVSCWHESPRESAAMWSLYSKKRDGIAVKTTFDSLSKSFRCGEDVFIGRVNYIDYDAATPVGVFDENDELFRMTDEHGLSLRSPLFHKRDSFMHEREVRSVHPISIKGLYSGGMTREMAQPPYEVGKYLEVDLPLLIEDVVVSPFAPDWFAELVCSVSTRHHLNASVSKSSLAGAPIWS